MRTMTVARALKATKQELVDLLAHHRYDSYPSLYSGHFEDAQFFALHHYGPTRKDLLLSIACLGLARAENGGPAPIGWHDAK